jgi:hypothetical protein
MPKYAAAVLLIVISGACLTLSYLHEGWFGKAFRAALGLGLPWLAAWLLLKKREDGNQRFWTRSYLDRLGLAYLGVVLVGIVVILIWPYVALFLMDSGLM